MRKYSRAVALGLAVAALVGCPPIDSIPGSFGELGNGKFIYACSDDSDAMCDGNKAHAAFNTHIAVGAEFEATFRAENLSLGRVESASPDRLSQFSSQTFTAQKAGRVGLLGMKGQRDVDLLHIQLREVDEVRIDALAGPAQLTEQNASNAAMVVGKQLQLSAYPWSTVTNKKLAGALDASWLSADETIAKIVGNDFDNEVTVRAEGPGTTTLKIALGEHEQTITITVTDDGSGGAGGVGGGSGGSGGSNATGGAGGGMGGSGGQGGA